MSASFSPAASSAFAVGGTGPMPIVVGRHAADGPGDQPDQRPQAQLGSAVSGVVTTQIAAPSFCPQALPAVTVASGSSRPSTGRSAASFSTVVSGRDVLVGVDDGVALPGRTVTGTISSANRPASLRRGGALVRAHGELVLLLARDRVLAAQVLRGLQHPAGHRVVVAAGRDPAAGQRVVQHGTPAPLGAPAHRGRVERRV